MDKKNAILIPPPVMTDRYAGNIILDSRITTEWKQPIFVSQFKGTFFAIYCHFQISSDDSTIEALHLESLNYSRANSSTKKIGFIKDNFSFQDFFKYEVNDKKIYFNLPILDKPVDGFMTATVTIDQSIKIDINQLSSIFIKRRLLTNNVNSYRDWSGFPKDLESIVGFHTDCEHSLLNVTRLG